MKVITLYIWIICWTINEACIVVPQQKCLENELNYYEHETDCSSYYLCDNGVLTTYSCPIGLYYNKLSMTCETQCERCVKSLTCFINERYTNKTIPGACSKYINCDGNGNMNVFDCKVGLHFNSKLGYCTLPELSNCSNQNIEKIETCPATKKCNIQDTGLQYPYPPDCSKYIYCKEGAITQIRVCVFPKQFSPTEFYCMTPNLAGCIECSNPVQTTTVVVPTTTEIPICAEIQQCPQETVGITLPFPEDCTKYIYCGYNNVTKVRICSSFKHYSPTLKYCELPEIAKCPLCKPSKTTTVFVSTTTEIPICPSIQDCPIDMVGFTLPYPEDCTKYIYCGFSGVKKIRTCTNNKYYSPTLQYCEVPEVAYCPICYPVRTTPPPLEPTCPAIPSCSPLEHGKTKPYPPQCSKYIYCNSNGDEIIRLCPNGFHYSTESNYCVHPDIAKCIACVLDGTEVTTLEPIAVNCKEFPSCADYYPGVMLPYGLDCRKYIYCDNNGTPDVRICINGYEFSSQLYYCTIPDIAQCRECDEITTLTTMPVCAITPQCDIYSTGELKPYPPDCTKYIYCNEMGVAEISICPEESEFSPVSNFCVSKEISDCIHCTELTTTTIEFLPTSINSTVPTTFVTDTTYFCPPIPVCNENEVGLLKSYPPDCSKYIYCAENGKGIISLCPSEEYFDTNLNYCSMDADCFECTENVTETPLQNCPETPKCFSTDIGRVKPFPPDCSKYIYCDEFNVAIISSCSYMEHFSPTALICTLPSYAECPSCNEVLPTLDICPDTPTCATDDTGLFKPFPPDCTKYIYCDINSEAVISICPYGTQFDPNLLFCSDLDVCHNCVISEPSTTEIDTTPTISNLTSNPDSTLTYSDTTFALETSSTTIDTTPNNDNTTSSDSITSPSITTTALPLPPCQPQPVCKPNDNNNRLPYPPECTMYIKCKKSSPEEYWMCPEGKEFSQITNWCEFPLVANCTKCDSDGTLPPVEGTETPPMKANTQPYFSFLNIGSYYQSRNLLIKGVESMMELDRN